VRWGRSFIAVGALCLIGASEPPARLPGWMAGCWVENQGDSWTEECWTSPRGGIMIGSGRSGTGDRLQLWETMQIMLDAPKRDGSRAPLAFYGAPNGEGRTMFVWRPGTGDGDGVSFENALHDYPQRIRYWRDREKLMVQISQLDGSRAEQWAFNRAGSPD